MTQTAQETDGSRRTVASYASYADAEHAVDYLSDSGFDVSRTAIVGRDLRYVEQVTGRMTYGKAALGGALTGALVGVLIGWMFGIFNWFDPNLATFWLALDGLWFGAIVGAVAGLLGHALSGGERDFSSIEMTAAGRYEILVDSEVADEAARLLANHDAPPVDPVPTAPSDQGGAPSPTVAPQR
jgi:hypothetical protein